MTTTRDFEIACDIRDVLAEGPVWDAPTGQLHWIDALAGAAHTLDPRTGATSTIDLGRPLGCLALDHDGRRLVAAGHALYRLADDASLTLIAEVAEPDGTRFNDGKVDAHGRLWVGTMSPNGEHPGIANLYRVDPPDHRVTRVLSGVTVSNGMGWNAQRTCFYHVDTHARSITCFDYDDQDGSLNDPRLLAQLEQSEGIPDGLCIDAEGGIWVAIYGDGAIRCYSPHGKLEETVALPVRWVTSLAFGGEDARDLYITSGTRRMSESEIASQAAAGRLLVTRSAVPGLPFHRYGDGGASSRDPSPQAVP